MVFSFSTMVEAQEEGFPLTSHHLVGGGLLEENLLPELLECCARLADQKLATDRGVYWLQRR